MKTLINYFGKKRFNMFDLIMILIGFGILIFSTSMWYWAAYTFMASIFQIILDHYYNKQKLEDEFDEEEMEKEWQDRFGQDQTESK